MLNVKRLLEINAEERELYEEGIISACHCGQAKVHMTEEAFAEITEGMEVEHTEFSKEYMRHYAQIEGVEFFCLKRRDGNHED